MKKIITKIKQYFCKHLYHWTWSEGGDVKAYYDEYSIGTCLKCNHKIYKDE